MEREVTLLEMLQAREARAMAQQAIMEELGLPVISFCLNIAGPVKNGPVLRRAFRTGLEALEDALAGAGIPVVQHHEVDEVTGCEALWAVQGEGRRVKEVCAALEDSHPLGRLWDLDVLDPQRGKWDREDLGLPPRRCLVCGKEGKGCASRRLHTLEELRSATEKILKGYFQPYDAARLAAQAARALLYEVCTTPKPGLVDRANNGSHRDMDLFTFLDSTAALAPYFEEAVTLGQETANLPPEETFRRLRQAGMAGERAMFRATGGINTHKGAVFSLGTLCAAAGRLWKPEGPCRDARALLKTCGDMARSAVRADFAAMEQGGADTAGRRFYLQYGLRGIRGEVADGLPSVLEIGLPTLEQEMEKGATLEQAGARTLCALMARVTDTNLLSRGGEEGSRWAREQAEALCRKEDGPSMKELEQLDQDFIARNLSPGGCADLLAITYFLWFCREQQDAYF